MVTRINGFSGMDIDSMVKSLMAAKRAPLDKLYQQKETLNWTRNSYREISSKLYDFRINKLTDKYGLSGALNSNKAVVTGNTSAIKAEATSTVNGIDMEVTVKELATRTSVETLGVGFGKSNKTTLAELVTGKAYKDLTDEEKEKEYTLNINGVSFTSKNSDNTTKSLFTGETSISSLIATINGDSKANVLASFDEISGKLILRSKTFGSESEDPTSSDGKIDLGVNNSIITDVFKGVSSKTDGTDAVVVINNSQEIKQKSNTFLVNGIQLTLLEKTGANGVSKITTQTDPGKTVETIKAFVEDYNNLLSLLNTKVNEEKFSGYPPLTDEQKKEMKESEITTWTEKAKSGLLKNDEILKSTIISMRTLITENLGKLSDMGITTGKYTENGKLYIDESKLKNAINSNPQSIVDFFQGPSNSQTEGLFDKLADKFDKPLEFISQRSGTNKYTTDLTSSFKEESVMGKKLKEYNKQIATLLYNLNNTEARYYKQFSAMETAMNKLNSQSSSLFSTGK
ncbi:flagellar filament capping protein FliD [Paenibacillus sp. FSL R7-0302]|uniref:flagellar filament capping protein FliD n=1 Tax=Paenibacillus sp. FSL R7-0302 TaxID=2921681 RepID=UPI0030F9A359